MDGASLEDHWNAGASRKVLFSQPWDYVVLQQGPSSRTDSQANLKEWAVRWSDAAWRQGTKAALYMVWPFQGQERGFELVRQSYRNAGKASGALILPAGEAWQEALRLDPALHLYQADRLHPTLAGTYLAALVIVKGLTGAMPPTLPARLQLGQGREFVLPEELAEKLRQIARKVSN
jgi:hypothetical protein